MQREMTLSHSESSSTAALKLAVVIACHNYADYVCDAVKSVQQQLRPDVELVVVDDGSTDASWEVISGLGVRAYRIENQGQARACAFGLDKTTAPFILFLDADDLLKPGALDIIIPRLDLGVAKLQFPLTRIDMAGNVISGAIPQLTDFRDNGAIAAAILHRGAYPTPPTSGNVFRRDVCQLLHDVDYEKTADGVILFAAPFLGDVVSISQEIGFYRVHTRNQSGVGGALNPALLERDITRFARRLEHLRRLIGARGESLVEPQHTYFFQERSFSLDVARGERPALSSTMRLIKSLWQQTYTPQMKCELTVFFLLAALASNTKAKRAIAYRYHAGRRSAMGLMKAMAHG